MMSLRPLQKVALAALFPVVIGIVGCASPASRESMSLPNFTSSKQFNKNVSIVVFGGSGTGAMESSNISDEEFRASIEDAIVKSKLFKEITKDSNSDVNLQVSIASLTKPSIGFTFEVSMETGWILTKNSDKTVLMKKSIKSTGRATTSDALIGATRIQIAVERAAQNNISQGLNAVAELNIK